MPPLPRGPAPSTSHRLLPPAASRLLLHRPLPGRSTYSARAPLPALTPLPLLTAIEGGAEGEGEEQQGEGEGQRRRLTWKLL